MKNHKRPTIGFALSGSGNRSTFYIGFLEGIDRAGITIDYLSAMSGGSLVAASYAAGTLEELKERALSLNKENMKQYFRRSTGKSGIYSLEPLEQYMRHMCHGKSFEEVQPKMAFVAADIETGEQVVLCMGDLARAACISCTLPAVFEATKWGGRTLVDGGLLNDIPLDVLKDWDVDILIGLNLRGTLGIFGEGLVTLKKFTNVVKKYLFIDGITTWAAGLLRDEDYDFTENPGLFTVLGKSLDLAIRTRSSQSPNPKADLVITPDMDHIKDKVINFNEQSLRLYYELGLETAEKYAPKIKQLVEEKLKEREKVTQ